MSSDTTGFTEEFVPTRYTLLSRLRDWEDNDSWKEFFDTYWRLIYSVARKSGLTEVESQEVVQETVISVAKHIHKFRHDRKLGSFKGWLRNLTRWRIELAAARLRRSDGTVAAIAHQVGYGSESALSAAFKRVTGDSPRGYRNSRHRPG